MITSSINSHMHKFLINGKFLAQRTTGVQRFAREIISELDAILSEQDKVGIIVPANAKNVPQLKHIKVFKSNLKASILWEQIWLPLYIKAHNATGIHLCHVAPVFKPDIVCIHDTNVLRNPRWFTRKVRLWYGLIGKMCAVFAKKIVTISNFSKNELKDVLKVPNAKIGVVCEGWQHLKKISNDNDALDRYGVKKKSFYFSLGTRATYKNMKWVYDYAVKHPNEEFAISGSSYGKIFGEDKSEIPDNVRFLGYLSDEEVKAFMRHCKAFIFPSFYEGFGIPPLEALSMGAQVIVSDIPVMHEIFEEAVHYIDPSNSNVDLDSLAKEPVASAESVLEKYSWEKGAHMLKDIMYSL